MFDRGIELYFDLQKRMRGRFAGWPLDAVDIYNVCERSGDHIEIGTAFGGSAIIAALAKKENGHDGLVYCVDPLDGYYGKSFDSHSLDKSTPSVNLVLENASIWGVEDIIKIFTQKHPPLPDELLGKRFETAYIDGGHKYEDCLADWNALRDCVNGEIMFHDLHKSGVGKVFDAAGQEWEVISRRCNNGPADSWKVTRKHIDCGVIGRVRKNNGYL